MIRSFDKPDDEQVKDFWMRACHEAGSRGSETVETLSGWLTAFCMWDDQGKRVRHLSDDELSRFEPAGADRKRLHLDGVAFPVIATDDVPVGVAEVPITLKEFGEIVAETTVVAGPVGMQGVLEGEGQNAGIVKVQPRSGWWMVENGD